MIFSLGVNFRQPSWKVEGNLYFSFSLYEEVAKSGTTHRGPRGRQPITDCTFFLQEDMRVSVHGHGEALCFKVTWVCPWLLLFLLQTVSSHPGFLPPQDNCISITFTPFFSPTTPLRGEVTRATLVLSQPSTHSLSNQFQMSQTHQAQTTPDHVPFHQSSLSRGSNSVKGTISFQPCQRRMDLAFLSRPHPRFLS